MSRLSDGRLGCLFFIIYTLGLIVLGLTFIWNLWKS